jgi:hypothetical protein
MGEGEVHAQLADGIIDMLASLLHQGWRKKEGAELDEQRFGIGAGLSIVSQTIGQRVRVEAAFPGGLIGRTRDKWSGNVASKGSSSNWSISKTIFSTGYFPDSHGRSSESFRTFESFIIEAGWTLSNPPGRTRGEDGFSRGFRAR